MSLKILLFVIFSLFLIPYSAAQRNYQYYNRLGFTGGFTLFDISTSDLTTKQGTGFILGFTTRGSFYNKFDLIYGINFLSNKIEILGRNADNFSETQNIDYTVTQLKAFRDGKRSNSPEGMMADIAAKMSNEDMTAVANYIYGLQ